MKLLKKLFAPLAIVALLVLPVATFSSGCTSAQQQSAVTVEYKTLSDVINVVDVARGVYDTLYKAGKVSPDLDNKVATIYAEYQRVGNLAIQVAKNQQAVVAAGGKLTDASNVFIPQLQTLVNQLIDLFNSAPASPQTAHVLIAQKAGV